MVGCLPAQSTVCVGNETAEPYVKRKTVYEMDGESDNDENDELAEKSIILISLMLTIILS